MVRCRTKVRILEVGEKKLKTTPTLFNHNSVVWIQFKPQNNSIGQRYVQIDTPMESSQVTEAFNVIWLQQNISTTNDSENKILQERETTVVAGKDMNSFYVKQLNTATPDAVAMVISRGHDVHVAMLTGFHQLFPMFSKSQTDKLQSSKEAAKNKNSELMRGICHRLAVDSGFQNGVGACRCVPLATWQGIMKKLLAKEPLTHKKQKSSPCKIAGLVKNFEDQYNLQTQIFGDDERLHDKNMYEDGMVAVIRGIAEAYVMHGVESFRNAAALLTIKKVDIQQKAARHASKLKTEKWTPTEETAPVGSPTTRAPAVSSNDIQTQRLQIQHLHSRVNDLARIIANCKTDTPGGLVAKQMLSMPSAFMKYVGKDNVPVLADMMRSMNSKNGGASDLTRQVIGQRGLDIWVGVIALILASFKKGLDCSKIAGEKNAQGQGNFDSVYDASAYFPGIVHDCIQGSYVKQPKTFDCKFDAVLKHARKRDKKSWKVVKGELLTFVSENFPVESELATAFNELQLQVGMSQKMRKLCDRDPKHRRKAVEHLKWIFLLYAELLPGGQESTTANFITTMLSKYGLALIQGYMAWLATGYYNLKVKANAIVEGASNVQLPRHITLQTSDGVCNIENTAYGSVVDDLFELVELLVTNEWDKNQTILYSSQQNARKSLAQYPKEHGNTRLGRAAGAWAYWLIGSCRVFQHMGIRPGALEEMNVYTEDEWKQLKPGKNTQAELRLGLNFIRDPRSDDVRYVYAHKTAGDGVTASPALFDKKASTGNIVKSRAWSSETDADKDGYFDSTILRNTFFRFLNAAEIIGGDPRERQYTINIRDALGTGQPWYKTMVSHVIASPAMRKYTKYHHRVNRTMTNKDMEYKELFTPLNSIEPQNIHKNIRELATVGITPCYRPPVPRSRDRTMALRAQPSCKTGKLIQKIFKECIAPAIVGGTPIVMAKHFKLEHIKPPVVGTGKVVGKVIASSKYTFGADNVASLLNLGRFGWTQERIDSVKQLCQAISVGKVHIHPNWFGRQSSISRLIAVHHCLKQIPDWTVGEAPDRKLVAAVTTRSQMEGHERSKELTFQDIIDRHYTDVHKTDLGNPVAFFAKFDERIRAHPTTPLFSLEGGIEQWPSTLVRTMIPGDLGAPEQPLLQKALQDVRLLSTNEQIMNLTTLTAYRECLQCKFFSRLFSILFILFD